jgi:hypothetical protein
MQGYKDIIAKMVGGGYEKTKKNQNGQKALIFIFIIPIPLFWGFISSYPCKPRSAYDRQGYAFLPK